MHSMSFETLIQALYAAPADKPFVTMWHDEDDIHSVTFGEFRLQAQMIAAALRDRGLEQGDTVILIMPQGIDLMAAFAGAMMLGAVPSILAYPNFKVEASKYRSGLAGVSKNLKARLVVLDSEFPDEFLDYIESEDDTQVVHGIQSPASSEIGAIVPQQFDAEGLAFIQHSAGTTGLQKGVALSHAAILRQLDHLGQALQITSSDRIYSWLPLYHDMGLIACFMLPMVYHLPIVMQSPTDWVMQPGTMVQLISEYRCTLGWVPNFTLQFVARRTHPDDIDDLELSSLRALINCSEPVRAQSLDEFLRVFVPCGLNAHALQSSYAMAENVFCVTQSGINGADGPQRLWLDATSLRTKHVALPVTKETPGAIEIVSSGQCLPHNEVRIQGDNGELLPDGAVGEILVRSDSLFDGYYNRPDLTTQALRGGWYLSGDLGFVHERELYVIGRKKDLIIVAGKNIYPPDVEEIAFSHPDIPDGRAVALGIENRELGTEDIVIVAEVGNEAMLEHSYDIERAVRAAVVAELGVAARAVYLKPPRWIVKSTAGKPARAATKDKLLSEHPELNAH